MTSLTPYREAAEASLVEYFAAVDGLPAVTELERRHKELIKRLSEALLLPAADMRDLDIALGEVDCVVARSLTDVLVGFCSSLLPENAEHAHERFHRLIHQVDRRGCAAFNLQVRPLTEVTRAVAAMGRA